MGRIRTAYHLLIPCFDRPKTNWERYTHALDRDTLLNNEGTLARIDKQLLSMIADARDILADENIQIESKILLNGFSASGSFANRFTALYPEKVAGTAAGGINSKEIYDRQGIHPQSYTFQGVGHETTEEINEKLDKVRIGGYRKQQPVDFSQSIC